MSTGNENLDLLIKLLGQTGSDNDNISLMAIRKANEQVAKFKTTWEDLLRGRVTIVADPFSSPVSTSHKPSVAPAASPPPPPRPAPRPTPQPQPQPTPQPQPDPQASPSAAKGKPNRYAARCHTCRCHLDANEGQLTVKDWKGRWQVECLPGRGHNKTASVQPRKGRLSSDDIMGQI